MHKLNKRIEKQLITVFTSNFYLKTSKKWRYRSVNCIFEHFGAINCKRMLALFAHFGVINCKRMLALFEHFGAINCKRMLALFARFRLNSNGCNYYRRFKANKPVAVEEGFKA